MTTHSGDGPGRPRGKLRDHEPNDVLPRANGAGNAEHELEMERFVDQAFGEQLTRFVDVAHLVALELRHRARLPEAPCHIADEWARVVEDVVAEVDGAAVQGRHLGPA